MKVAALISGGVDSAVSVHRLLEQGYKPHPGRDTHHHNHQPRRQHRKEQKCYRGINHAKHPIGCPFDDLCRIADVYHIRRHSTKHCTRPLRIIARLGSTLTNITAHSVKLLNIVLREHPAIKLRSETYRRDCKEQNNSHTQRGCLLQYFEKFIHFTHL